jgi:hypothetical protein
MRRLLDRTARRSADTVASVSRLPDRLQQLSPIVPWTVDLLAHWPNLQNILAGRPEQRSWIAIKFSKPHRLILWFEDHRHTVMQFTDRIVGVGGDDRECP